MTIHFGKLSLLVMVACLMLTMTSGTVLAKSQKPTVYVIGDSLSDPGNLYSLTGFWPPSPPYAERFSNGPVWAEYFAADIGIVADNRAYAGAFSGVYVLDGVPVSNFNDIQYPAYFQGLPGVSEEIDSLLADYPKGLDPKALYVVWVGPNDFVLGLAQPATLSAILAQTAANIAEDVCRLGTAGARHFVVGNLTDIGLTPFAKEQGADAPAFISQAITEFNVALTEVLNNLPSACAETLEIWDTNQFLQDLVANPASFGLTNTTDACLVDLVPCPNPKEYLFWDTFHPTTSVHKMIAEQFRSAICETDEDDNSHSDGSKYRQKYLHAKDSRIKISRCWEDD